VEGKKVQFQELEARERRGLKKKAVQEKEARMVGWVGAVIRNPIRGLKEETFHERKKQVFLEGKK